jgi:hypothetical protein
MNSIRSIIREIAEKIIFENSTMDKILDKIQHMGINSLSNDERDFLSQHSKGAVDADLERHVNSNSEVGFDEFGEDEDIFEDINKLKRVISKVFGPEHKYTSSDFSGRAVWRVSGDLDDGIFIFISDSDEIELFHRKYNEDTEENEYNVLATSDDTKSLYNLMLKAKAFL